jgi:hypothetical protein
VSVVGGGGLLLVVDVEVEVVSVLPEGGSGSVRGLRGARATEWRVMVVEAPLAEVVGSPASRGAAS